MTPDAKLAALRSEAYEELTSRILPYWMNEAADRRFGGTVGTIDDDGTRQDDAPKGCILHARVLWTFSAAYRALGDESYREAADRSAQHFTAHFVDPTFGGVYWMVDAAGRPVDERKHVYAQAFAIYALVEHHRATGDSRSLDAAMAIARLVEAHAFDARYGGYEEAFSREWRLLDDVRLSPKDANERKSMNTHLHLLEAYTPLVRVWPDARLQARIESLLELFLDRIIVSDGGHVGCFFTSDWKPRSRHTSFGHDIETSWLLVEGARAVGNEHLLARVEEASLRLATAVLTHGFDRAHGGLFTECVDGILDTDKEWWPQAEAIVGFLAAYRETGRQSFLDAAVSTWTFIKRHVLDGEHGEWRWRTARDGSARVGGDKVGPWKCPYHNGRACLEVMARVDALLASGGGRVAV